MCSIFSHERIFTSILHDCSENLCTDGLGRGLGACVRKKKGIDNDLRSCGLRVGDRVRCTSEPYDASVMGVVGALIACSR